MLSTIENQVIGGEREGGAEFGLPGVLNGVVRLEAGRDAQQPLTKAQIRQQQAEQRAAEQADADDAAYNASVDAYMRNRGKDTQMRDQANL